MVTPEKSVFPVFVLYEEEEGDSVVVDVLDPDALSYSDAVEGSNIDRAELLGEELEELEDSEEESGSESELESLYEEAEEEADPVLTVLVMDVTSRGVSTTFTRPCVSINNTVGTPDTLFFDENGVLTYVPCSILIILACLPFTLHRSFHIGI